MKYIITESKFDKLVTDYLYEMFDVDNINWTHPLDYNDDTDEEWEDNNRIEFYIGDYGDEQVCFRWYDCEYFTPFSYARDICPTVSLETEYETVLNGYFGDKWHEPFKKWFKYHFELPVKTID